MGGQTSSSAGSGSYCMFIMHHFSIVCYLNSETKVIKHKKKKSDRKKGKEDINDAWQIAIFQ